MRLKHKTERCLFGNVGHTIGYIPQDEQHGRTARLSLAMVHYLSRPCLLVFHRCLVVQTLSTFAHSYHYLSLLPCSCLIEVALMLWMHLCPAFQLITNVISKVDKCVRYMNQDMVQ
jgi:hypothetical protein